MYVPQHGSPYVLFSALSSHLRFPLHCAFTFLSDVDDLHWVVLIDEEGQILLPSDRPYIAAYTYIFDGYGQPMYPDWCSHRMTLANTRI